MRLLWASNSPWSASGYGVQTKLVTSRIAADGHQIAISANHGLEGKVLDWGPIPVYGRGFMPQSQDIIIDDALDHEADGLIIHYDAQPYDVTSCPCPTAFYYPVDMHPLSPPVEKAIKKADLRIAISRYGQRMTEEAGMSAEYAPHAFDPAEYYYEPPEWLRNQVKAYDRYVVGIVAANYFQPPRKCWPQLFEAFSIFQKRHPEALLYVHSLKTTETHGCNLELISDYFGIPDDAVAFCNQYQYRRGFPEEYMRQAYSLMDCLLLVSMGEGFGVPLLEAQACGTPCVTGQWTAMGEIAKTGTLVPTADAYRIYMEGHSFQYLPRPAAIADALERQYAKTNSREVTRARVAEYEADHVYETHWRPVLKKFEEICTVHEPRVIAV